MFKTIQQIMLKNRNAGHHFFDEKAMSAFQSQIYDEVIEGYYFITSEDYGFGRKFNIREANSLGHVALLSLVPRGKIHRYDSYDEAKEHLLRYLKNKNV